MVIHLDWTTKSSSGQPLLGHMMIIFAQPNGVLKKYERGSKLGFGLIKIGITKRDKNL